MLKRVFALGMVACIGCASGNGEQTDPCERALQRLVDDCGYEVEGIEELELHCTGESACVADCLESSPCSDIDNNKGEFADCTDHCASRAK